MNKLLILLLLILFSLSTIYYLKHYYNYGAKFYEGSFKISKESLNVSRNITCFIDFCGNRRSFLNNYKMNEKLKKWFIKNTQDQAIIDEIAIGSDKNIEKIYFTKGKLILGYKIDSETNKSEKCIYYPEENKEENYLKFIDKDKLDKIKHIIPIINENTLLINVVLDNNNKEHIKSMYTDFPAHMSININDQRIKEVIKILGFFTPELNRFLEENKDKVVSFLCFGKDNKYFSLYYLDKENAKIKRKINGLV